MKKLILTISIAVLATSTVVANNKAVGKSPSLGGVGEVTQTIYLSGTDADNTVNWDFKCSKGMNSGKWRKIAVPSCWEMQGFGEYTYGRYYLKKGAVASDETGHYRHSFKVPANWKDKKVEIVFEGVMTDTKVLVNGQEAGEEHQGGFTAFSYDITSLLDFGKKNKLEVFVEKQSKDKSVNAAERRADWWLFGGIYRPVYLRALPKTNITHVAVDARANGQLNLTLTTEGDIKGYKVETEIVGVGTNLLTCCNGEMMNDKQTVHQYNISTFQHKITPWDPEHPNLYTMIVRLIAPDGRVAHEVEERIGFRTIEFRRRDGFYLNGKRLVVKGVNRHCCYAETGRTTSKKLDIEDVKLIKNMNANAIRSHYPPDKHLLDICDSLGVLYLNELPGWHGMYNTKVGSKILKEMVMHDANHPSIFLWSNGNEGGFNIQLDSLFAKYDPQKRHVIHPWALWGGTDTHHYPAYQTGVARLANGYEVFMPTEFLHAQYDKGAGASLEDFWNNYKRNPLFAGGFIWAWADEGIIRTDLKDSLDTDGPNGPDGIVGPHREREGSWYTIRDVWSPIQIQPMRITPSFDGKFIVSNNYLFSNLSECKMTWELVALPSPLQGADKIQETVVKSGLVKLPCIGSGESGTAEILYDNDGLLSECEKLNSSNSSTKNTTTNYTNLTNSSLISHPSSNSPSFGGVGEVPSLLRLTAYDKKGDVINVWTYMTKYADEYFASQKPLFTLMNLARATETTLAANGVVAEFSKETGMLVKVTSGDKEIPFNNGPLPVGMKMELKSMKHRIDGNDAVMVMKYAGAADSIVWRMTNDGMLCMDAVILNRKNGGRYNGKFFDDEVRNLGFSFSYPEKEVTGMQWLGKGPYRVWRNRQQGANYGLWQKDYNNTITGEPKADGTLIYPEFKGHHANMYWATIQSENAPFTVYSETDGIYLRMFTPQEPHHRRDGAATMKRFPEGDISFLLEIQPIQSYKPLEQLGPQAMPPNIRINAGDQGLRMKLWFDFR